MNTFNIIILAGLGLLLISNLILAWLYLKQQRFFKSFTQDISKKDLKTLLKQISLSLTKLSQEVSSNQTQIESIIRQSQTHFQKIGFIRFNPFSDTGGDQSFCLCLLDNHDTGLIITSLHSREQTRIYAKSITKGKSDQQTFFEEEKQALKAAQKYTSST